MQLRETKEDTNDSDESSEDLDDFVIPDCYIVCFDLTDAESFDRARDFINQVDMEMKPYVVLGMKSDYDKLGVGQGIMSELQSEYDC